MNDIELCQELMKRAEEYQKRKEREFAIAELEKIKEEIRTTYNHDNWDKISRLGQRDLDMAIIDNHISELKGENK